jgi:hypothetical protein
VSAPEQGGLSEAKRNLAAHVIDREGNVWRIVRDGGMATRAVFQGAISVGIAVLERDYGPLTNLATVPAADAEWRAAVEGLAEEWVHRHNEHHRGQSGWPDLAECPDCADVRQLRSLLAGRGDV